MPQRWRRENRSRPRVLPVSHGAVNSLSELVPVGEAVGRSVPLQQLGQTRPSRAAAAGWTVTDITGGVEQMVDVEAFGSGVRNGSRRRVLQNALGFPTTPLGTPARLPRLTPDV